MDTKKRECTKEIKGVGTAQCSPEQERCLSEIKAIILRNDDLFAGKILIRAINLEKTIHR